MHFRTAHEYPTILWQIAQFAPTSVIRLMKRSIGKDPLTSDPSWRGAKPLDQAGIRAMCGTAGLDIVEFCEDATHKAGTRTFAVVRAIPD